MPYDLRQGRIGRFKYLERKNIGHHRRTSIRFGLVVELPDAVEEHVDRLVLELELLGLLRSGLILASLDRNRLSDRPGQFIHRRRDGTQPFLGAALVARLRPPAPAPAAAGGVRIGLA